MDENEKILSEKVGRNTGFTVPQDYFEQLPDAIMAHLPEQRPKLWTRARLRLSVAAAAVVIIAITSTLLLNRQHSDKVEVASSTNTSTLMDEHAVESNDEAADMANYAMMDSEQIYAYLSEAEGE